MAQKDRTVLSHFVDLAGENQLLLIVVKTREIVIDFRRNKPTILRLCFLGENVDSRLNWRNRADSSYRKGMSRLDRAGRLNLRIHDWTRVPGCDRSYSGDRRPC